MTVDECILILLRGGFSEGRNLFNRLSLTPWKHRPLANDLSARFALHFHYVGHMCGSLRWVIPDGRGQDYCKTEAPGTRTARTPPGGRFLNSDFVIHFRHPTWR